MNTTATQINCPHCGESIDVSDVLRHQLEEQIRNENQAELKVDREKLKNLQESLKQRNEALLQKEEEMQDSIRSGVKQQIASEKKAIEKKIRETIEEEKSAEIKTMQEELRVKSKQVIELNQTKASLAQAKRVNEECESRIRTEVEIEKTQELNKARTSIQSDIQKSFELKLAEKDLVIGQMNEQVKEAQRKAEQSSMQRQGEVQELAVEEFLQKTFPLDTINEVKKGDRGCDCVQIVNTRTHSNCGSIYYESKRTKDFKNTWLEKFKADMRSKGAILGVLITDAMPKGTERMTQMEGIWVCSFEEFKALSQVLREWVIATSEIQVAQVSKGDKMALLYDLLTGPQFRCYVEAIVESFVQMKTDLESEKRSMQSIWKKREKQIEKVQANTIDMYASIKAIAGNAIGTIEALELTEGEKQATIEIEEYEG